MAQEEGIDTQMLMIAGVTASVLVVVTVFAMMVVYYVVNDMEVAAKEAAQPNVLVGNNTVSQNRELIPQVIWANPDAETVKLPISRSMNLTVDDYARLGRRPELPKPPPSAPAASAAVTPN